MPVVIVVVMLARQQGIDLGTESEEPTLSSLKYLSRLASRCQGR